MFRRLSYRVLTGSTPSEQREARGTKTFSPTGAIENTGLIEVPTGTTLREIFCDIGGGLKSGAAFKGSSDWRTIWRMSCRRPAGCSSWILIL